MTFSLQPKNLLKTLNLTLTLLGLTSLATSVMVPAYAGTQVNSSNQTVKHASLTTAIVHHGKTSPVKSLDSTGNNTQDNSFTNSQDNSQDNSQQDSADNSQNNSQDNQDANQTENNASNTSDDSGVSSDNIDDNNDQPKVANIIGDGTLVEPSYVINHGNLAITISKTPKAKAKTQEIHPNCEIYLDQVSVFVDQQLGILKDKQVIEKETRNKIAKSFDNVKDQIKTFPMSQQALSCYLFNRKFVIEHIHDKKVQPMDINSDEQQNNQSDDGTEDNGDQNIAPSVEIASPTTPVAKAKTDSQKSSSPKTIKNQNTASNNVKIKKD